MPRGIRKYLNYLSCWLSTIWNWFSKDWLCWTI